MNFYYGLVDEATNAWGFLEETDSRVKPGMVRLTQLEWQTILSEQSKGRQIVGYDGKCFTAEPGRYYLDNDGWHKKSDEQFNEEKAQEKREYLVNKIYQVKADKAYGGVIINDMLVFETNQTAITNTVASLALMDDTGSAAWKFYTIDGTPVVQRVTKMQLAYIAKFGQAMINACFEVEGQFNLQLGQATVENLIDEAWVEAFEAQVQGAMDQIVNHITVNFEG